MLDPRPAGQRPDLGPTDPAAGPTRPLHRPRAAARLAFDPAGRGSPTSTPGGCRRADRRAARAARARGRDARRQRHRRRALQLVAADHPERLGALVLTNCDAFEHFPPPRAQAVRQRAGAAGRRRRRRRARRISRWARGLISSAAADGAADRRRAREVVDGAAAATGGSAPTSSSSCARSPAPTWSPRPSACAAFDRPALLAWATRDPYFPFGDARAAGGGAAAERASSGSTTPARSCSSTRPTAWPS